MDTQSTSIRKIKDPRTVEVIRLRGDIRRLRQAAHELIVAAETNDEVMRERCVLQMRRAILGTRD